MLLKTQSSPSDGYEEHFRLRSALYRYKPYFVPVLEHRFRDDHIAQVQSSILLGHFALASKKVNERRYGGFIFTSQRAVDAFATIIHDVRAKIPIEKLFQADLPLYVVGPATARSLRSLNLPCRIVGEHTGNGEALAHFILDDYREAIGVGPGNSPSRPSLLFLVGEQRRDIIPRTLQDEKLPASRRVRVEEVTVYETCVMESFAMEFSHLVKGHGALIEPRWVVVFSPTGCKAMLETLGLLDQATGKATMLAGNEQRKSLIVCIGPTTRDFLVSEFGFEPDACAQKPSPEGVADAIEAYISSQNT